MTESRKYLRTEPPAMLEGALTLELSEPVMEALNEYRQARHAFYAGHRDGTLGGGADKRDAYLMAASSLAAYLSIQVARALAEPSDWADAE